MTHVGVGNAGRMSIHPASVAHAFAAAFNSRDADAVDAVYEPGGLFVPRPGHAVTGPDRRAANQEFLDSGLPITVTPRHVYAHDGVALLIVDWSIGEITGTATDVARLGADGRWRYVIDNPFGTTPVPT